jgi:hypothetical protein
LLIDAPAHSKERIAASRTIDLGINLHENEFRIYDSAKRSKRFSGAVVSGTHSRPFLIDPRELNGGLNLAIATGGPGTGNGVVGGALALVLALIAMVLGEVALALPRRVG